jgi:hypothetical protein
MRRLLPFAIAFALVSVASPLVGQQARVISAGMTVDDVRSTFGAPSVVRQGDGWTYFFYTNRCLPRCGTDDTVFFADGRVIAAVLHSPARRFDGPPAADALPAPAPRARSVSAGGAGTAERAAPARVTGIRVRTADGEPDHVTDLGVIRGSRRSPTGPQPTPEGSLVAEPAEESAAGSQ